MKLNHRTLLSVLALAGALAMPAMAADKPAKDTPAGEKAKGNPLKDLNLSDEQKEKVKAAQKTMQEKMQEVRSGTGSPEEKKAAGKKARDEYSAKMKEILTAEQYDKWQKSLPAAPQGGEKRKKQQ
jgi:Spy/CpxP family protein refolding chaperone